MRRKRRRRKRKMRKKRKRGRLDDRERDCKRRGARADVF